MYKLIILTITVGSFVFSGAWSNTTKSDKISNTSKIQYCWVEDTSGDDKIEAGRRRGKGKRVRRRGGNGLR